MTYRVCVFCGPTLQASDLAEFPEFEFLPPAEAGDFLHLILTAPDAIGLVDGFFGDRRAVQHKEIIETIAHGVSVYGAASMGALRAAELDVYGMIGIGEIYMSYRRGERIRDDDVAVAHGPAETGYMATSVPQTDVEATVLALTRRQLITPQQAHAIVDVSRSLFFPDRAWASVARAVADTDLARSRLSELLERSHVQAKRLDALAALRRIRRDMQSGKRTPKTGYFPPITPTYRKIRTGILGSI